jgi:hypothetical protein
MSDEFKLPETGLPNPFKEALQSSSFKIPLMEVPNPIKGGETVASHNGPNAPHTPSTPEIPHR